MLRRHWSRRKKGCGTDSMKLSERVNTRKVTSFKVIQNSFLTSDHQLSYSIQSEESQWLY